MRTEVAHMLCTSVRLVKSFTERENKQAYCQHRPANPNSALCRTVSVECPMAEQCSWASLPPKYRVAKKAMSFVGLASNEERAVLICFLRSLLIRVAQNSAKRSGHRQPVGRFSTSPHARSGRRLQQSNAHVEECTHRRDRPALIRIQFAQKVTYNGPPTSSSH